MTESETSDSSRAVALLDAIRLALAGRELVGDTTTLGAIEFLVSGAPVPDDTGRQSVRLFFEAIRAAREGN